MTKGSGLKKNVSSAILRLQDNGKLEKLRQDWFLNATECVTGTKDKDQESEEDTATRGQLIIIDLVPSMRGFIHLFSILKDTVLELKIYSPICNISMNAEIQASGEFFSAKRVPCDAI